MDLVSVTYSAMYTLFFNGQPIFQGDNWHDTALAAVRTGLASFAFGVIFTLVPGADIKAAY